MPDYYLVKIGSTWLTDDGTGAGTPCRVQVGGGAAQLKRSQTGGTQNSADNTPHSFVTAFNGEGVLLRFSPTVLLTDEYDDLFAELDALDPVSDTVNVTMAGAPGDYDLECVPVYPDWIEHPGEFVDDRLYGLVFVLAVKFKN